MNIEQMTPSELADKLNGLCVAEFAWPYLNKAATELRRLAARDAQWNALIAGQAGEAVAWPAELSSISRTQPVRFNVIYRDDGEPVIDDDDFKFDALIKVHGDFGEGEKEKYVAEVCRRLNGVASPPAPQEAQADCRSCPTCGANKASDNPNQFCTCPTKRKPYCYIYEWDTPFGLHQSTSSARYNGMAPNRSVPVFAAPVAQPATEQAEAPVYMTTEDCMRIIRAHAPDDLKGMEAAFRANTFATQPTASAAGERS